MPLPLDITATTASLPVSQTNLEKCEEHHHNQPQEIPQSIPDSQHPQHKNEDKLKQDHKDTIHVKTKPPKQPQPATQAKPLDLALPHHSPKIHHQPEDHRGSKPISTVHTKPQAQPMHIPHSEPPPTFPFQKQLPSSDLPQTYNLNELLPNIDPYPTFKSTYHTIPQTKAQANPQPTLQSQTQISMQPMNQLPSEPKLVTDPRLKFQPTFKPLQSHNVIPEQPQQKPTPNLIHQASQQTSQPKYPNDSQQKLMSQTTTSNNIQQPIHPNFQAQPRMLKPLQPLFTSEPILQSQSEFQQRSEHTHQNELHPELQPWTQKQFQEVTSEAQPQPATQSLFQTKKQTHFLPTTEALQHSSRFQTKHQKESQTYQNPTVFPQTETKTQSQKNKISTVHSKVSPQLTSIAPNKHQVQWEATLEPFVHTQQQIKLETQPMTTAPLSLKPAYQTQNREQHQNEPPIQSQLTSELITQTEPQLQATFRPKPQIDPQSQLKPPAKVKPEKKQYPQEQPTSPGILQPLQPQPQPTSLSNLQNKPYPESQTKYLAKPHPQQHPQSEPTLTSKHQTQPQLQSTSKVSLQNELNPQSQPESHYHHQPQQPWSTLNSILQTQKPSQSPATHQNEGYQQSQQSFQVQPLPPQSHPTHMCTLHTKLQVLTVKDNPKPKRHREPNPQTQTIFYPTQPIHNEPYRTAQPSPEAEPQAESGKMETQKPSQYSWNESDPPLEPMDQAIPHPEGQAEPIPQLNSQTQSYPQSQLSQQDNIHSTSTPVLQKQTSPKSTSPVTSKKESKTQPPFQTTPNIQQHTQPNSQLEPHPKHQNEPTAIPIFQIQSQSSSHFHSHTEPYTDSEPTYHDKHRSEQYPKSQPMSQPIHQTKPPPTSKVNIHNEPYPHSPSQTQVDHQPQPQTTINSFLETPNESQSLSPYKQQNEPYPQSQQTFQAQYGLYQSQPQPLMTEEPYRKAQPSQQAETQTETQTENPQKTNSWHEAHPSQPAEQGIHLGHHQQQFQTTLQPKVQTQPYKQSQLSPEQPQMHSTSVPILHEQIPPKSTLPVKPKHEPYPKSHPPFQAISNPQQHVQPPTPQTKPQNEPQAKLHRYEPKPTAFPTFQTQSESTLHSKSHNKLYPESQPLVHTIQTPQIRLTLKSVFQTDSQTQPTSELKSHNTFQSQSHPVSPFISTTQQSVAKSLPMHQTKMPNQSISKSTPENEPLQFKETLEEKHEPKHQQIDPTFKPQQTQQPTYQTQIPLEPNSQTQHSDYQSTSHPIFQTKRSPVFKPIFQIQTQSTPHAILQMHPQTQPGNKPLLPTQPQDVTPQPTHPQPETKQQPPSHPTSQTMHQDKPQQTIQPTNWIPKQHTFQPTHKNLLETQPKSEKEPQPQQQTPKHSDPQNPKQPQQKANRQKPSPNPRKKSVNHGEKSKKQKSTRPQPVSQTQTHSKTKMTTEPKAENRVQMTLQPNVYSRKTPESQPKLQPTSQPVPQFQSHTRPQPRSTPTTKMQTIAMPKLDTHQSQHKPTPHHKSDNQVTTMFSIQPQMHASPDIPGHPEIDSQSISSPHLPSKTLETVLKQHYTSWPQLQPQAGLQTESQTRSYTDPTKVTPGQALFKGKHPTFDLSDPQNCIKDSSKTTSYVDYLNEF